jgi:hypothetical protein
VVAEQTMGVRFEPCPWYADGDDDSAAACCHCGWLEDDHREEKLPGGSRLGGVPRTARLLTAS